MQHFRDELARLIVRSEEIPDDIPPGPLADYLVECVAAYQRLNLAHARYEVDDDEEPRPSWYERGHKMWVVTDFDDARLAKCRNCGNDIRWAQCRTRNGIQNLPLDVESEIEDGDLVLAALHLPLCSKLAEEEEEAREEVLG